jgi:hypothetical protein
MIGELTDKGMDDVGKMFARIDDVPYECLPATFSFLERLEKGWQVEYHLDKENKIRKIARVPKAPAKADEGFTTADKMKKAGFNQPTTGPAKDEVMTDKEVDALKARADEANRQKNLADAKAFQAKQEKPEQPVDKPLESGIKTVQGQITAIDAGLHTLTVKDIAGIHHEMMWKAALVEKMATLKQWFFVSISAEKSGDLWVVIDQTYFKKPDNWIAPSKPAYGGKPFTPRNERIIVAQMLVKTWTELYISGHPGEAYDSKNFAEAREEILKAMEADVDRVMKAGGA